MNDLDVRRRAESCLFFLAISHSQQAVNERVNETYRANRLLQQNSLLLTEMIHSSSLAPTQAPWSHSALSPWRPNVVFYLTPLGSACAHTDTQTPRDEVELQKEAAGKKHGERKEEAAPQRAAAPR